MRSTSTRRRLIAGGGVALALFGGLIVAERGSESPAAPVSTKSIAASRPAFSVPQINVPSLLGESPLLSSGARPAALPSAGPSTQQFGEIPGNDNICDALFKEREALLDAPDSPAVDAQLALNSFWLAVFHCEEISGDPEDEDDDD